MKNIKFSRLFAAFVFVAILALAGCKQQPEETHKSIEGIWLDASYGKSYYKITGSTFENYGENTAGVAWKGYEGNNVSIVELSNTAGTIFIKYTKSYEKTTTAPTGTDANTWTHQPASSYSGEYWYRYSSTAPDVGKWYAVSYKELNGKNVKISGAVGAKTSCNTLEEAKQEFTADKGYFNYYSDCVKQ